MSNTSLQFITCDEFRQLFNECREDINKRILILDVRKQSDYNGSHFTLDQRNNIDAIRRKMRVINIDPDIAKSCTIKGFMLLMNPEDLNIFKKRKDATDVIVIDNTTENVSELSDPKSKVMRLINGLTKFDNQVNDRIEAPIKVLQGGFYEWQLKYPHFTTDPTYNPDITLASTIKQVPEHAHAAVLTPIQVTSPSIKQSPSAPALTQNIVSIPKAIPTPIPVTKTNGIVKSPLATIDHNSISTSKTITPSIPLNTTTNSNSNIKSVPGTAIAIANRSFAAMTIAKPRFDRNLKPAFNMEAVSAIKSQLDFGRCPETSSKTITGLQNLGNTCFMNSVIQCLAYAPTIVTYFCSDHYYNQINFNSDYGTNGELAIEFGALVEKLNSRLHKYIEPKSFKEAVVKHIGFAGCEQQDSHEFMMMLFDKLHHDLNLNEKQMRKEISPVQNGFTNGDSDNNINVPRSILGHQFWKKHLEFNKSIISDTFEGIFLSTLTCSSCDSQSNTFEVFNCLSLPIPSDNRCHLTDCLDYFSRPEKIEAAWDCPKCKQKREAIKKIVICKLPKILIIHLKRFSLEGRWRQKLQTTVDFPHNDLTVDCANVLPQSAYGASQNCLKNTYNLYAVVNHYGHLDGGHYTASCKLEDKQYYRWYYFDDSNVTEMKESDVCAQSAYILFYILAVEH